MSDQQPPTEVDAIDKTSLLASLDQREAALIAQQNEARRAVIEIGGRILEVRNVRACILNAQPKPPQDAQDNGQQPPVE